jgi:hypothetical protein
MERLVSWKKISIGSIAGILTISVLSLDRLDFLASIYKGTTSWFVLIILLYLIGVMNFIGGLRREYTMCLAYIAAMALYDVVTINFQTVLFAGLSTIMLILGVTTSVIVSWVSVAFTLRDRNIALGNYQKKPIIITKNARAHSSDETN